ncbi:hypothetical protein [Streptomyces sp. NPDC002692]
MTPDLDDRARGLHGAIRDTIEAIGGDVAAFDHDPLTAESVLDDFVSRLPRREFETDDWIWLHTQLVASVGEVLPVLHHMVLAPKRALPSGGRRLSFSAPSRG